MSMEEQTLMVAMMVRMSISIRMSSCGVAVTVLGGGGGGSRGEDGGQNTENTEVMVRGMGRIAHPTTLPV